MLLHWASLFGAFCLLGLVVPLKAASPVLIVSIDGFRWDYFDKAAAPNLRRFAAEGVKAKALIPPFPSDTFPSHYSMVTGLHPEKHGIIGNVMRDPAIERDFNFRHSPTLQDKRWWIGEPIWITAQRQGLRSATCFWPGTDVEVEGGRPTYWLRFDDTFPNAKRIAQIATWLQLPANERPHFLTLYLGDVDKVGHRYGPDSKEIVEAVNKMDETFGELLQAIPAAGRADLNIIVVSDHGMAQLSHERVIPLVEYLSEEELALLQSPDMSPSQVNELLPKLARIPHVKFHRRSETPERLHFRNSERISQIVPILDEGWTSAAKRPSAEEWEKSANKGGHGFDNRYPSMHGIFLARGPAFRKGAEVPAFLNLHVYHILTTLLGIEPAHKGASNPSVAESILAPPAQEALATP